MSTGRCQEIGRSRRSSAKVTSRSAAVEDQKGWGNVIYIPAAPMCAKNAAYAQDVAERFRRGESPADFPREDYEVDWSNRFSESQLNEIGRRGLVITQAGAAPAQAAALRG